MNKKPFTVYVFTASFPYGNGETFIAAEIEKLASTFHEVCLVPEVCDGPARKVPANVRVLPLLGGPKASGSKFSLLSAFVNPIFLREFLSCFFSFAKVKAALKTWQMADSYRKVLNTNFPCDEANPKLFYTYWCDYKTLALARMKSGRSSDFFVTRLHGWDVYEERHRPAYLPFRRFMAARLDGLYFISEHGLDYVKNKWKIHTTDHFFLSRLGTPNPLAPIAGRTKMDLVSCSSVIPLKQVSMIADAVISLNGRFKWTHLGAGEGFEELNKKVENKNAPDFIHLAGLLDNQDIHSFFATNDIQLFINVSTTEGLPVSVMEAMSYGIPVMATDVGGTSEIVKHLQNGLLLPAGIDAQGLKKAIVDYFELPASQRTQMAQAAYETWKMGYSADQNLENFAKHLRGLINRG